MAELTAGNAGREAVVADSDLLVHVSIGEIVRTLRHGAHEDADGLVLAEIVDVFAHSYDRRIETERDLPAIGRQVVRDGVLYHLEKLLLGIGRLDGEAVEELHHQAGEPLERPGDSDRRRHFDQHALGRLYVDLKLPCLVDGRVEKREQALSKAGRSQHVECKLVPGQGAAAAERDKEPDLVSDVGSSITDITVHLAHDTNVLVAVEQRVLLVSDGAHPACGVRSLVRLEAGIGEDYDEPLRVLVVRSNGNVLLCHQLGEGGRRQRLGSCE